MLKLDLLYNEDQSKVMLKVLKLKKKIARKTKRSAEKYDLKKPKDGDTAAITATTDDLKGLRISNLDPEKDKD